VTGSGLYVGGCGGYCCLGVEADIAAVDHPEAVELIPYSADLAGGTRWPSCHGSALGALWLEHYLHNPFE
jgi:hypothetical protein